MADDNATTVCIVKFVQANSPFNAGERASVGLDYAKRLILAGKCVLDDPDVNLAQLAVDEEEYNEDTADNRLQDMTAQDAEGFIKRVDDIEELKRLWEGERRNPKKEGGRKGVLVMLRQRAHELESPVEA